MATFVYKAINPDGRQVADTVVAPDRASAIEMICGRSLSPVSIERQEEHPTGGLLTRVGRVSKGEVEAFTRQLANLLAAGVPLSRGLSILSREASKPAAGKLWATVHDQVAGGMSLADSLSMHPRVFSPVYVAMVRAGETGGFLDVVLEQIATFRSREQDLKNKVLSALLYPLILAVLAGGVIVFLLTFFIPRFSTMFAEFGGSLPVLTRTIVTASRLLVRYWFVLVLVIALGVFGIRRALSSAGGPARPGTDYAAIAPVRPRHLALRPGAVLPHARDAGRVRCSAGGGPAGGEGGHRQSGPRRYGQRRH